MSIINRACHVSQQREVLQGKLSAPVATGSSATILTVPFACALQAAFVGAYGLSGTPQVKLQAHRFTSAGATVIELGISNLIFTVATGVSGGPAGYSGLQSLGSSFLALQANDVIKVTTAGTNAAATELTVALVVQKTQDIVQHLGLSS